MAGTSTNRPEKDRTAEWLKGMSPRDIAQIEMMAEKQGMPVSEWVAKALTEHLDRSVRLGE